MKMNRSFKIGLFGGSFNPIHKEHLNIVLTAQKIFQFNIIKVIPAFHPPGGRPITSFLPQQRLKMIIQVFAKYPFVEVDDQELKRRGLSYTIDTIKNVRKNYPGARIFFIIGQDQLESFYQWRSYKSILKEANLLVCSRKGFKKNFLSKALKPFSKRIHFFYLKGLKVSSSEIRKKLVQDRSVKNLLPPGLKPNRLKKEFKPPRPADKNFIKFCRDTLLNKKAKKIKVFDLRKNSALPFDFTLLASGLNTRHARVMAQFLQKEIQKKFSLRALAVEGENAGGWIVLDYDFLMIHICYHYEREKRALEELWAGHKTMA